MMPSYLLDVSFTVHILRFVELPPSSSSVKGDDGSDSPICNRICYHSLLIIAQIILVFALSKTNFPLDDQDEAVLF